VTAQDQPSIAHRTALGAAWLVSWRLISRLLGLGNTFLLARLLVPGDFGIVAIATTYVTAFDALSALGTDDMIVRSPNPTRALFDTGFTVAALRGLLNAVLVVVTAPLVARAFDEPRLLPVLLTLAILPVLDGFENIAIAEFRRTLRFDLEFIVYLVPRFVSVATAVAVVLIQRTFWAMVIGIIAGKLCRFILSYYMRPFLPRPTLSAWREFGGYSFWSWAASIVGFIRDRGWTLLLGVMLSATDVGIFNIAAEIAQLPITEMVNPISRAAFAGISASRNAGGDIANSLPRIIGVVLLVTLPAALGISSLAYEIVLIGLGAGWATATLIIAVIGASSPSLVIMTMGNTALAATGNIRYNFFIMTFSAAFALGGAAIGAHYWGLLGVTAVFVTVLTVESVGFLVITMRILGGKVSAIAHQVWRPALASAVMAIVLYASGLGWSSPSGNVTNLMLHTAITALVGAATYSGVLLLLWWVSGMPDSAERFLLDALRLSLGRFRRPRPA
jgi:lipopolysaccharide exporter